MYEAQDFRLSAGYLGHSCARRLIPQWQTIRRICIEHQRNQYAVIRCIEIIGEAVKNVPPSMRERCPDIPWNTLAGIRDKVIHSYFGVSVKTIWLTVTEDFPGIQKQIHQLFIKEGADDHWTIRISTLGRRRSLDPFPHTPLKAIGGSMSH